MVLTKRAIGRENAKSRFRHSISRRVGASIQSFLRIPGWVKCGGRLRETTLMLCRRLRVGRRGGPHLLVDAAGLVAVVDSDH